MKRTAIMASVFFFAALISSRAAAFDCQDPVETEYGAVRGEKMEGSESCVWRGIPFAAPPVGELRWASPRPHPGWEGVRDATQWSAQCMQKGVMALEGSISDLEMSEDCLYLNVWRPRKEGVFPVMVWIHGGGYQGGSSMTPWYWGDRLAEEHDLVVVTINYRLAIFGFFAHPEQRAEDPNGSTGNQGSLDQAAALQWVHKNIASFGGDPGNVTIFGESAGGWSICTMVATPLTSGLFQHAILESGGCEHSESLEKGYQRAGQAAAELDCEFEDIECLRSLPAETILNKAGGSLMSGFPALNHHDGYLLSSTPLEHIKRGDYNKVDFMAGFNRDEFGKALKLMPSFYWTRPKNYEKKLKKKMDFSEEEVERLVELYPLEEFNNRPVEAYGRMMGVDAALACPTYLGLLRASQKQDNTWLYRFDYDDYRFGKYMGAAHAMEIPFIFNNLDRSPASFLYKDKHMPAARELSEVMQGYVVNFARTGNPNGEGLLKWPRLDPEEKKLMVFDANVRVEDMGIQHERCEFWEEHSLDIEDAVEMMD